MREFESKDVSLSHPDSPKTSALRPNAERTYATGSVFPSNCQHKTLLERKISSDNYGVNSRISTKAVKMNVSVAVACIMHRLGEFDWMET